MGAVMTCYARMGSAMLYRVVSLFLARPDERKCYSIEQEDTLRPLFRAFVYLKSGVRNSVNTLASEGSEAEARNGDTSCFLPTAKKASCGCDATESELNTYIHKN